MKPLFPSLVFDFETTGLLRFDLPADDPAQPRIASIAAVMLTDVDAEPVVKVDCMIKPDGWTMPDELVEELNTGLYQSVLEEQGIPIADAMDQFLAAMDEAEVLTSYGITFDTKMLRGELRRLDRPDLFGTKPEFCLMRSATKLCKEAGLNLPGRRNAKLTAACETLLGRTHDTAHTAMGDTLVAADLYRHCVRVGCAQPKIRPSTQPAAA